MDSIVRLKVKIMKGEGVEVRPLDHNISKGRGLCWSFGMGLG